MAKLTCKKIKQMIKDEEKGAKEYMKYKLPCLAKDELHHKRILKQKLKSC